MIATAVPTRRREVLAIDMDTVLRPIRASVNPLKEKYAKFWLFRPEGNLTMAQRCAICSGLGILSKMPSRKGWLR
jgi:hypothetical protein